MFFPIAPSDGPQRTPKHMNTGTGSAEPAGAAIAFDDGTRPRPSTVKG